MAKAGGALARTARPCTQRTPMLAPHLLLAAPPTRFVVVDVDVHATAVAKDGQVQQRVHRQVVVVASAEVEPRLQVICTGGSTGREQELQAFVQGWLASRHHTVHCTATLIAENCHGFETVRLHNCPRERLRKYAAHFPVLGPPLSLQEPWAMEVA